jgi:hypothetical protein
MMTVYSSPAPLRLTLRGRRVLLALITATVLALFTPMLGGIADATNAEMQQRPLVQWVTVQPGETLWGIAKAIAPERDPREVVWEIQQINRLANGLVSGEQIRVPVY